MGGGGGWGRHCSVIQSSTFTPQETTESTSACRALAINLLVSERRILTKVKSYCEKRVDKVKTKQNLAPLSVHAAPEPMSITEIDEEDELDETVERKANESQQHIDIEQNSKDGNKSVKKDEVSEAKDEMQNGINDVSEDLAEIEVAD